METRNWPDIHGKPIKMGQKRSGLSAIFRPFFVHILVRKCNFRHDKDVFWWRGNSDDSSDSHDFLETFFMYFVVWVQVWIPSKFGYFLFSGATSTPGFILFSFYFPGIPFELDLVSMPVLPVFPGLKIVGKARKHLIFKSDKNNIFESYLSFIFGDSELLWLLDSEFRILRIHFTMLQNNGKTFFFQFQKFSKIFYDAPE